MYSENCKGQIGSVAQPGMKPVQGTSTVERDTGFYSHLLMCRFMWILMRENISSLGFHFQSCPVLKVCLLKAVMQEELWKAVLDWHRDNITGVCCVLLLHRWQLCKSHFTNGTFTCLIIDFCLNLELASVNSRKVWVVELGSERFVFQCNVPLIIEVFSAQCPNGLMGLQV